jgi:Cu/Ag efflux protein CusF
VKITSKQETIMKSVLAIIAFASTLIVPAIAQQKTDDRTAPPTNTSAPAAELASGEVRKVDKDAKKLTIRHGEIKSLDMPPMTMVFLVRDAAQLDALKVGDKIRFVAEKSNAGYMVTEIRPAP